MVNNPNIGFRSYSNSPEEKEVIGLLKSNNKLVIDLISLFTINDCKVKTNVVETFGKLGITQSSIDELNQILYEISINREENTFQQGSLVMNQLVIRLL